MRGTIRLLSLTLGACLLFALFAGSDSGCDKKREDILVTVAIIDQPEGGSNVSKVSCTFEATMTRSDGSTEPLENPAEISSVWNSTHGFYNDEVHLLYFPGQPKRVTTSKSAPEGYCLDKPFWLKVSWIDSDGKNEMASDTAYCD